MGELISRRTSMMLGAAALIAPSALRAQTMLPDKTLSAFQPAAERT